MAEQNEHDYQVAIAPNGNAEVGAVLSEVVIGGEYKTQAQATKDARSVARAMNTRTFVIARDRTVAAGPFPDDSDE